MMFGRSFTSLLWHQLWFGQQPLRYSTCSAPDSWQTHKHAGEHPGACGGQAATWILGLSFIRWTQTPLRNAERHVHSSAQSHMDQEHLTGKFSSNCTLEKIMLVHFLVLFKTRGSVLSTLWSCCQKNVGCLAREKEWNEWRWAGGGRRSWGNYVRVCVCVSAFVRWKPDRIKTRKEEGNCKTPPPPEGNARGVESSWNKQTHTEEFLTHIHGLMSY